MIPRSFIFFNDVAMCRAKGQSSFVSLIYSGCGLCLPFILIVNCTAILQSSQHQIKSF